MKYSLALLFVLGVAGMSRAQERIPDEEARPIAQILIEAAKTQAKPPIASEVDGEKPFAVKKDEHGAMVLPEKKLTAERIDKAGKDLVPVGQLWMRRVTPLAGDKPMADKFQTISVKVKDNDVEVKICYVAVQRTEKDGLQLVLLGKDKTPVVTAPLEKSEQEQDQPIEFTAKGEGDDKAAVTVQILGKYQAKFLFMATTE